MPKVRTIKKPTKAEELKAKRIAAARRKKKKGKTA